MICKLAYADWQIYKELRLECLKNTPWAFGARYVDERSQPDNYWQSCVNNSMRIIFTFVMNNENVAMAGLYLPDTSSQYNNISFGNTVINEVKIDPANWFIVSVYCKPEYRGNGYVEELLRYLIEYHQHHHNGELLLGVEINNASAIALYKKLGFIYQSYLPRRMMGDGQMHQEILMRLTFK